jgi:UDP-N-acetylmuramoyl-L-alanyl-D-glutamate--2,6-diaminopimelate ligase
VVVDYAHTPNALETILKAFREHTQNNLICVFGCGGDRDSGKRPLMAAVVEQYADVVIVTDDNPRTESPVEIMRDIVAGFQKPELVTVEHDRATAIQTALKQANTGDAVLIAGKGHESVQILATGTVPFSDREQANKVLQELAA